MFCQFCAKPFVFPPQIIENESWIDVNYWLFANSQILDSLFLRRKTKKHLRIICVLSVLCHGWFVFTFTWFCQFCSMANSFFRRKPLFFRRIFFLKCDRKAIGTMVMLKGKDYLGACSQGKSLSFCIRNGVPLSYLSFFIFLRPVYSTVLFFSFREGNEI